MVILSDWKEEYKGENMLWIISNEEPTCPACKSRLEKHGWIYRIKRFAGNLKGWRRIEVRKCTNRKCGKKHRLLPDDQVPYKHYEAALIERVIADRLTENEILETEDYPCDSTVKRWKIWAKSIMYDKEQCLKAILIALLKTLYIHGNHKCTIARCISPKIRQERDMFSDESIEWKGTRFMPSWTHPPTLL